VIRPSLDRGASLWPFDGTLAALAGRSGLLLAETYPAEANHIVRAGFRRGESKQRQSERRGKAGAVHAWAERHGIVFNAQVTAEPADGFGSAGAGAIGSPLLPVNPQLYRPRLRDAWPACTITTAEWSISLCLVTNRTRG
jgi:hypothetical protein